MSFWVHISFLSVSLLFVPLARGDRAPTWIASGKSADSFWIYEVGSSAGAPSEALAREQALTTARQALLSRVLPQGQSANVLADDLTLGVEVIPDGTYVERKGKLSSVWVLASWPLAYRNRAVAHLQARATFLASWQAAQDAVRRGDHRLAIEKLTAVCGSYGLFRDLGFELPQAEIQLADSWWYGLKEKRSARRIYKGVVARPDAAPRWRDMARQRLDEIPVAPEEELLERWNGASVTVCAMRTKEGGAPDSRQPFQMLGRSLSDRLTAAGFSKTTVTDPRGDWPVQPNSSAIVLALWLVTDQRLAREPSPTPDTTVYMNVFAPGVAKPVYTATFKARATDASEANLCTYTSTIAIRYLSRECPPIGGP